MQISRPIVTVLTGLAALALIGAAPPDRPDGPPDHARVPDHVELPFADDGESDETVEPQGVIALVDTGINPYHVAFRDDSDLAQQHPSTYLEDYPEGAKRLDLTLDAASYEEAVEADCEAWERLEAGQLYWIPGTKIVGAVAVLATGEGYAPDVCDEALILDGNSHGTMTASRAAAADWYGACETCRIVAVQGVVEEETGLAGGPQFARNVEWSAQQHPTFFATGNGILAFAGSSGTRPGRSPN